MCLPLRFLALSLSILPSAFAILADEAYHIDYHHELLGLPLPHTTFFHRPRKDEKATLLYTLSDLGVLGAVNPATGKLVWRQALGDTHGEAFLRGVEGEATIVSGLRNKVGSWNALTGISRWHNEFSGLVKDLEVMETAAGDDSVKDVLVLSEENETGVVRLLDGKTGDVIWEFKDPNAGVPLQVSTNLENVFLVSLMGKKGTYNVRVSILNPQTGDKRNEYTLTAKADIESPEDVLVVGTNSAFPIIAWTDKAKKNLKINILTKAGSLQTVPLHEFDDEIQRVTVHAPHNVQSLPHFLVHMESTKSNKAEVYHINLVTGDIEKAYELPKLSGKSTVSVSCQDENVFFIRISEDEVTSVSSLSHGILGRWPLKATHKNVRIIHATSEVVQRSANSYAVRAAAVTDSENWVLIRNGDEIWTRLEGLSGAIAADWAEIPGSESLVATLQAEAYSNPLLAFVHRVKRHINELRNLPGFLQKLIGSIRRSITSNETTDLGLTRDYFGFSKLVFVATVRGSFYALNSGNQGTVIWSSKIFNKSVSNKWDVKGIWTHMSENSVTVRGGDGEYVVLDSITGTIIQREQPGKLPAISGAAFVKSSEGRWWLPIGKDGLPEEVSLASAPNGIIVTRGPDGEVNGIKFEAKGNNASPIIAWTFYPAGQNIINVVSRPVHDPVASIGRVLGDRSVLYKYLNPNVVLVTAVSKESSTASFYLLDTVSGEILYSTSHEHVDTMQPITSVLTENWFAYSLWSDVRPSTSEIPSSKGYQIVVSDLYESNIPNDRGPLGSADKSSSLEPSEEPNSELPLPHVVTQSFLIPESISHMAVTKTRQGITTRQLICTLTHSNAIIGIPRHALDPRRPVGRAPTPAELEEGLTQYQPYIEFDPKSIITHKREVLGVMNVITSPALLESTSLIFAYGIDIFGTRVAPSMAFDVLGKGFNKPSLLATVLALAVGVGILAPMVKRKQINGRWMASQ